MKVPKEKTKLNQIIRNKDKIGELFGYDADFVIIEKGVPDNKDGEFRLFMRRQEGLYGPLLMWMDVRNPDKDLTMVLDNKSVLFLIKTLIDVGMNHKMATRIKKYIDKAIVEQVVEKL
jgi:hypothetical protein